jgi:hypothetical protein
MINIDQYWIVILLNADITVEYIKYLLIKIFLSVLC